MIDGYEDVLTIVALVAAGLNAGIYYAFSTFVMRGLDRLPHREAVGAMQAINVEAVRPGFMLAFMGTAVVSIVLAISALGRLGEDPAIYQLVGAGLYLAVVVLTGTFHVPRNNVLAEVDRDGEEAASAWDTYYAQWTAGNHVRALLCAASAVAFTLSLLAK